MKKKKMIANSIMIAAIVVIAAIGVLFAGQHRGWFDRDDTAQTTACATRNKGVIDMTRDGIATHLEDSIALRSGDRLSANKGAQATVSFGDSCLVLGESASILVTQAAVDGFSATVLSGEVFLRAKEQVSVTLAEQLLQAKDSTVVLSVRTGSVSVGVLAGEAVVGGQALSGGQAAYFAANSKPLYTALQLSSLSHFLISCAQTSTDPLCFTAEALSQELADREAPKETVPVKPDDAASSGTTDPAPDTTPPGSTSGKPDKNASTETPTCTIEIRCDTILDNLANLEPGKDAYVPTDGIVLAATTASFTEGETVFDVLKRVCEQKGIPLEYSYTPLYESYYVEGIHHLYEFDCGSESGWMYKVNGWFPNYGCSDYALSQGDTIVWCYTCNGLGADVGGSVN